MEIILAKGTDIIQFGLTQDQCEKALGIPDIVYQTDTECIRAQYNKLLLELSFEPENDNRLGWIEVHNPSAKMLGQKLIGKNQQTVQEFLTSQFGEEPEIENYGSFITVAYDSQWVELQFKFGSLANINLGVLYDTNDEPIWPVA